jgi:hypothetical protein
LKTPFTIKLGRGRPPKYPKVEKPEVEKSTKVPKKHATQTTISQGSQVEKDLALLWIYFEENDGIKDGQTTASSVFLSKVQVYLFSDFRSLFRSLLICRLTTMRLARDSASSMPNPRPAITRCVLGFKR